MDLDLDLKKRSRRFKTHFLGTTSRKLSILRITEDIDGLKKKKTFRAWDLTVMYVRTGQKKNLSELGIRQLYMSELEGQECGAS